MPQLTLLQAIVSQVAFSFNQTIRSAVPFVVASGATGALTSSWLLNFEERHSGEKERAERGELVEIGFCGLSGCLLGLAEEEQSAVG